MSVNVRLLQRERAKKAANTTRTSYRGCYEPGQLLDQSPCCNASPGAWDGQTRSKSRMQCEARAGMLPLAP